MTDTQGICSVCSTVQLVHLIGDPDLKGAEPQNYRLGYHTSPGGKACDGFDQPPTSLYVPQGASAPRQKYIDEDDDHSEVTREGDYMGADDDDYPDEYLRAT